MPQVARDQMKSSYKKKKKILQFFDLKLHQPSQDHGQILLPTKREIIEAGDVKSFLERRKKKVGATWTSRETAECWNTGRPGGCIPVPPSSYAPGFSFSFVCRLVSTRKSWNFNVQIRSFTDRLLIKSIFPLSEWKRSKFSKTIDTENLFWNTCN